MNEQLYIAAKLWQFHEERMRREAGRPWRHVPRQAPKRRRQVAAAPRPVRRSPVGWFV